MICRALGLGEALCRDQQKSLPGTGSLEIAEYFGIKIF